MKSMDEQRVTEALLELQRARAHLLWPGTAALAGEGGCRKHSPPPPPTWHAHTDRIHFGDLDPPLHSTHLPNVKNA